MRDINLSDIIFGVAGVCLIILMIGGTVIVVASVLPGFAELAKGKPFILSEYEQRNRIVQDCLAAEQYTRDECIRLAGGK